MTATHIEAAAFSAMGFCSYSAPCSDASIMAGNCRHALHRSRVWYTYTVTPRPQLIRPVVVTTFLSQPPPSISTYFSTSSFSRTSILLFVFFCPTLTFRLCPPITRAICSHQRFFLTPTPTVLPRRITTSASAFALVFSLLLPRSALSATSLPSAHHLLGHARAAALISTLDLARNERPLPCDTEAVGLGIIIGLCCAPLLQTQGLKKNGI